MSPFDTQVFRERQICFRFCWILKLILEMAFSAYCTQIWKLNRISMTIISKVSRKWTWCCQRRVLVDLFWHQRGLMLIIQGEHADVVILTTLSSLTTQCIWCCQKRVLVELRWHQNGLMLIIKENKPTWLSWPCFQVSLHNVFGAAKGKSWPIYFDIKMVWCLSQRRTSRRGYLDHAFNIWG